MGLPEWDIYTDLGSAITWSLDLTTPIVESGSLLVEYDNNSTALGTLNALPTVASGYPEGFTAGKLRTIFKVKAFPAGLGTYPTYFGIVAMQGARNITGGDASGKTFYALSVCLSEDLSSQELQLNKVSVPGFRGLQNLNAPQSEVLFVMPYPHVITPGFIGTIELQWIADIPNLNGVYFIARTGVMTDYSDLTDRFSTIDVYSPLATTMGEGLWTYMQNSIAANTRQITFDNTTLFSLS